MAKYTTTLGDKNAQVQGAWLSEGQGHGGNPLESFQIYHDRNAEEITLSFNGDAFYEGHIKGSDRALSFHKDGVRFQYATDDDKLEIVELNQVLVAALFIKVLDKMAEDISSAQNVLTPLPKNVDKKTETVYANNSWPF